MRRAQKQTHTHMFRRTDALRTAGASLMASPRATYRILSFGCSTGEEIVTLRSLFPQADLYGCEWDADVRSVARQSVGHLARIIDSTEEELAKNAPYDLINCSAVLCLNPPTQIAHKFPSREFDNILRLLDRVLATDGVLVITNASYRFQSTPIAGKYDPVRSDIVHHTGFVDVFAHDGRPFLERVRAHTEVAFCRGAAFEVQDEEELADSVFRKRPVGEAAGPRMFTLAPIPRQVDLDFEFSHSNLAGLPHSARANAIEVNRHYRFGVDRATGDRGCSVTVSWNSLSGKVHQRPSFWHRLSDFFGE